MKYPSTPETLKTFQLELDAVFGCIDAFEDFFSNTTCDMRINPVLTANEQGSRDEGQRLSANYSRLVDEFCEKYEITDDERDQNFCNC